MKKIFFFMLKRTLKYYINTSSMFLFSSRTGCPTKIVSSRSNTASSKTLTSGPGATDNIRSTDGATDHTRSTADHTAALEKKRAHGSPRSTTEQDEEGRSTFNLHFLIHSCYLFIIFLD